MNPRARSAGRRGRLILILLGLVVAGAAPGRSGEKAPPAEPAEATPPQVAAHGKHKFYRLVTDQEARNLTQVRTRPWNCPVCGNRVEVPEEEFAFKDSDADLCPHPVGKVKFFTAIALCPYCGFSAYKADFMKPQSEEIKTWVASALTKPMNETLRHLFALQIKVPAADLPKYFSAPEDLPDILRCEHAFMYYAKIKADPTMQGKIAWQTAWAYRRAINGPVHGPYVMDALRKILDAVDKERGAEADLEERVNLLAGFYEQRERFGTFERQLVRLLLGGYYDRLGLTAWARTCFEQVEKAAKKEWPADEDPWVKELTGSAAQRTEEAKLRREVLAFGASMRLEYLHKEQKCLELSSAYLRNALNDGLYPAGQMPSYIYLIGEFERRREMFARAKLWLEAAAQLQRPGAFQIEHLASQQLETMNDYLTRRGGANPEPANDPAVPADARLLAKLIPQVRAALAAPAPAAPAGK